MTLNEKLNKIDENTTWIKRTITGAIVTAICTGVIGGAIAIMYNLLQKAGETDMKFADKGTVVRTVLLLLALLNQTLLMFGKSPLNIQEDQVSQLADTLYAAGSAVFTIITTAAAWFKNNYVTAKGKKQQALLKINNLSK